MPVHSRKDPWWHSQFVLFAGVGVIGTAAHYVLLSVLVEVAGVHPVPASTAGAVLGALVNYFLNRQFTFRSDKRHREALTKFLTIAALGLALNGLLMFILVDAFGLHYLLAQFISTGLVLVWNFMGNRFWTFSDAR